MDMDSAGDVISTEERRLLQEAAEWRLISLLFECPDHPWSKHIELLKADVRDPLLRQIADAALAGASEGVFHSLFGPGGPVPPREVTYQGGNKSGHLLSGIAAYYQAFSYRPETMEADDHFSVETGFVAYLKVKEAYALNCGHADHAALASEAAQNFIQEHLAAWIGPFVGALTAAAPPYLVEAGKLIRARIPS